MFEGNMESGENVRPANGGTGGQMNPPCEDPTSDNGGTQGTAPASQTEQRPSASS
jgi:hypothetical protein